MKKTMMRRGMGRRDSRHRWAIRLMIVLLIMTSYLDAQEPSDSPKSTGSAESAESAVSLPGEDTIRTSEGYRTPRAGEEVKTTVFGESVHVPVRDRRSVSAWTLGITTSSPGADENELLPYGSLFFWRNSDDLVMRGVVAGLYNELRMSKSTESLKPAELALTFKSFTVPVERAEIVDGIKNDAERLQWGYVRGGFGPAYRKQVSPGYNDNILFASVTYEPSLNYFLPTQNAAVNFRPPSDTYESRFNAQLVYDALERNLLELPHLGFAFGGDLTYGYRHNWDDWGLDQVNKAADTRDFFLATAYFWLVGGVPFVDSERHRLVFSVHGGTGVNLDRFSAIRVGGGPQGEEFRSMSRPIMPGAAIEEFFPEHYAIAVLEYRYELAFFAYLGPRASLSYLDRDRLTTAGIVRQDDVLASIGWRLTSGFFFESRIQLDYNYNAGIVRGGEFGGHEVAFQVARDF